MLSPSQFAEKINKPYSTVMAWLKAKRIVGAKKHKVGKMEIWLIPQDAPVKLPTMGRPSQKGVSATSSDEESDEVQAESKRQVSATKKALKKTRRKASGN